MEFISASFTVSVKINSKGDIFLINSLGQLDLRHSFFSHFFEKTLLVLNQAECHKYQGNVFFFCLDFLSRTFTNHRTVGKEGGCFFNSSFNENFHPFTDTYSLTPCEYLKLQSCKLYFNKYVIASSQITNARIVALIVVLVPNLLSRKVLFMSRKDNRNC